MAAIPYEEVVSVRHWTDRLFSFVVTRHPSFRFEAGQFSFAYQPSVLKDPILSGLRRTMRLGVPGNTVSQLSGN